MYFWKLYIWKIYIWEKYIIGKNIYCERYIFGKNMYLGKIRIWEKYVFGKNMYLGKCIFRRIYLSMYQYKKHFGQHIIRNIYILFVTINIHLEKYYLGKYTFLRSRLKMLKTWMKFLKYFTLLSFITTYLLNWTHYNMRKYSDFRVPSGGEGFEGSLPPST